MSDDLIAALLAALGAAELALPVYDGDPPTEREVRILLTVLELRGFKVVRA